MRRRTFTKNILLGAGIPLTPGLAFKPFISKDLVKPKGLRPGDTIGLITPGSPLSEDRIEKGMEQVEKMGFHYKAGKHIYKRYGYLAGKDGERLEDLHRMFEDPEVDAIWCIRGGYGCTRLLPHIDYQLIRNYPKLLMGYSDITALHMALYRWAGLVSFHSPVAVSEMTEYTLTSFQKMVNPTIDPVDIKPFDGHETSGIDVLRNGEATGSLIGGNLSLISALCGTSYLPSFKDCLVFLEDVGEKPYRIDRMLVQLIQASNLEECSGIILGRFADCEPGEDSDSLTLKEVFENLLIPLGVPIIHGFSFGHIDDQCTLPQGIMAKMNTSSKTITLLENPVI